MRYPHAAITLGAAGTTSVPLREQRPHTCLDDAAELIADLARKREAAAVKVQQLHEVVVGCRPTDKLRNAHQEHMVPNTVCLKFHLCTPRSSRQAICRIGIAGQNTAPLLQNRYTRRLAGYLAARGTSLRLPQ